MLDNKLQLETVDSYKNQPTDDPHLFRVVNREGDWTHYWQDEIKQYLPAVNHILQLGFPKGQGLIQWMKKMDEAQAEKVLNSAAERGARVHAAIRALTSGQKLSLTEQYADDKGIMAYLAGDEWDCLIAWVEWAKVFKPKVLRHETALWSPTHFYAGTADFIGTIELPAGVKLYIDDKLVTVKETKRISVGPLDYKTGGTYDEHKLQVSSYAGCLRTKPKGEFYTGVVRLGTRHNSGYEVRLWSRERTKYHFGRFLDAKKQYHFVTGNQNWQPDIVKIPLTLQFTVPQIKARTKKGKSNV